MSQLKSILLAVSVLMAFGLAGCSSDEGSIEVSAKQEKEIAERLAPAGEVVLEGETTAPVAAASASAEPRSGEEIYNTKCTACHSSGAAGAPIPGNAEQWAPRIAQGTDALYTNAIAGIRGMPPKGLCMDCSDDEIKATVDYMVAQGQ
ncbi:MAG: c-type cytochrome [bacterium]